MLRNVMVIDDDPDICELLTVIFEGAGFVIRSFPDGLTALEELRSNEYDLLVLDISLPQMNGFRVLKAIRANPEFKNIPVIVLTASREKESVVRFQNEVSDYVIKPLRRDDFLKRVERILRERPRPPEVLFDTSDPLARGQFEIPIRLRSINSRGAVLSCAIPLPRNYVLQTLQIALLQKLGVVNRKFKVAACFGDARNGFTYFVSFLGVNAVELRKIQTWITNRSSSKKGRTG